MGWDRAPEELTWERLLGLDGSLVFLEHVFWVISLNTLFVLIFGKWSSRLGYIVHIIIDYLYNMCIVQYIICCWHHLSINLDLC